MRGRPDREDYFCIGLVVFFLSVTWFGYSYQVCGSASARCLFDGMKEWQTLFAGLLAMAAAIVTVMQLRKQIRQSEDALRHERDRRAFSHRAMLPLLLSDICDFVESDNQKLKVAIADKSVPTPIEWPNTINDQLETLRSVIEFEDQNKEISESLRNLISQLQVYRARRRPKSIRPVTALEGLDRLRDAAEIYISASSLFEYARGEQFRRKSPRKDLFEALRSLGYWDGIHDEVYNYLGQLYPDPEIQDKL